MNLVRAVMEQLMEWFSGIFSSVGVDRGEVYKTSQHVLTNMLVLPNMFVL